jgi:hypothetical protein
MGRWLATERERGGVDSTGSNSPSRLRKAALARRTFQDLGRAASVHDFVVRAISGHATTSMQEHYSSVSGDEVRTGLAKVLALAGIAKAPPIQTRKAS